MYALEDIYLGSWSLKLDTAPTDLAVSLTEAKATAESMLRARPDKSLARRLSETEKAAVLAEIQSAFVDAVRRNDRVAQLRATIAAAKLGKPFTRKMRFDLLRRTMRVPDDVPEED